jgi:hypothetical protein
MDLVILGLVVLLVLSAVGFVDFCERLRGNEP